MKRSIGLVAPLLAVSCAVSPPGPTSRQSEQELAGRMAGPATRCVLIQPGEAFRMSETDGGKLIYGRGRTVWANESQCRFSASDVLITEPIGPYFCRGDLVRSFDRVTRIPGPACRLGNFVPYSH